MAMIALRTLWDLYRKTSLPEDSSEEELAQHYAAFYAGMLGLLKSLDHLAQFESAETMLDAARDSTRPVSLLLRPFRELQSPIGSINPEREARRRSSEQRDHSGRCASAHPN